MGLFGSNKANTSQTQQTPVTEPVTPTASVPAAPVVESPAVTTPVAVAPTLVVAPAVNYDNPKIKNAYPNVPVIQYQKTSVSDADTVAYMLGLNQPLNVKRAAYTIFYIESADGKDGLNNNYEGIQADGDKLGEPWDDLVIATIVEPETMTGNPRRFCVFANWSDPLDYLINRVSGRGLYIGGYAHPYANMNVTDPTSFGLAYYREWVEGDGTATPSASDLNDIVEVYNKSVTVITK